MSPSKVQWMTAPIEGFWRIGRSPEPIYFAPPLAPEVLDSATGGNRFDSPTRGYSVCYFATELDGCFGEVLSRFRPDPGLSSVSSEEGFMLTGEIPADWRHRRLEVRARPQDAGARFLDVEALETREVLREELGELLAYFGHTDLDVSVIRGGDRRVTRWVGAWAHAQHDEDGEPAYAGVRYLSRLNTDWECWAVFDHTALTELERKPILLEDPALSRTAAAFDLRVY